jgi:hypothetical protein
MIAPIHAALHQSSIAEKAVREDIELSTTAARALIFWNSFVCASFFPIEISSALRAARCALILRLNLPFKLWQSRDIQEHAEQSAQII